MEISNLDNFNNCGIFMGVYMVWFHIESRLPSSYFE